MTVDYSGIAVLIGAVTAGIASLATTVMQWLTWKQSKKTASHTRTILAAMERDDAPET